MPVVLLVICSTPGSAVAADACPNAVLRAQQHAEVLPDCRAFEQVSPVDKLGADILNRGVVAGSAGDAVHYGSLQAFSDGVGAGANSAYRAVRGPGGWITPRRLTPVVQAPDFVGGSTILGFADEPDLGHSVLLSPIGQQLTPDADPKGRNLFVQDDATGALRLVSPSVTPLNGSLFMPDNRFALGGASGDLSHVVFSSDTNRTSDASGSDMKVYEWADGALRLVGVDANGDPMTGGVFLGGTTAYNGPSVGSNAYPVSEDGARIFFISPSVYGGGSASNVDYYQAGPLYLREDRNGAAAPPPRTVQINIPQRPVNGPDPDGPQPAEFWRATPSGSYVLFTSCEKLTDDATAQTGLDTGNPSGCGERDLYRYATDSDDLQSLTTADPAGADVTRVLAMSDDGRRVYFTARGNLATGASGTDVKTYLWQDGDLRLVADGQPLDPNKIADAKPTERATPDGRILTFLSGDSLAGHSNANTVCDDVSALEYGCRQMYVYDADADGGAGALSCASCPTGDKPDSHVTVEPPLQGTGLVLAPLNRTVSDDGARVFFSTAEPLVLDDTNGLYDAYEYDVVSGERHLLSGGSGTAPSYFADADADGDSAFFVTTQPLTSSDRDENLDLYVARVEGGFPEPPRPAVPCGDDHCQGPPTMLPAPPVAASIAFQGEADLAPTVRPVVAPPAKVSLAKRTVRGTSFTLKVKAPGKGRITAGGANLRTARRTATRAATYGVVVSLTDQGRRALAKRRRLSVKVRVAFSPTAGQPTVMFVSVTLEQPVKHGKGRR